MAEFNYDAYEPPQSLWRLVEENVLPGEREEIRDILGMTLVEQSLELQNEVSTLLDIWRDYRDDVEAEIPAAPVLPEPPLIRESLCNQIRVLLESLREKAKEEGRDSGISLTKSNSDIIDYVMEDRPSSRGCSPVVNSKRPGTAMSSRMGRETPLRMTPCSDSDMLSATSSASDQVESVKDQLNILKIDEIVQELRTTLQDEVDQLKRDITFLHSCLEDESDFRSESKMSWQSEPSLQDLRNERGVLQKEVEDVRRTPSSIGIINSVKPRVRTLPNSPKRLPSPISPSSSRMTSPKLRPSPPPSASITRSSPIKASHNINHNKGISNNSPSTSRPLSDKKPSMRSSSRPHSYTSSSNNNIHKHSENRTKVHRAPGSPVDGTLRNRTTVNRAPCSPVDGMLRPSPPPSAKPPSGRPAARFRTRIKDVKQATT